MSRVAVSRRTEFAVTPKAWIMEKCHPKRFFVSIPERVDNAIEVSGLQAECHAQLFVRFINAHVSRLRFALTWNTRAYYLTNQWRLYVPSTFARSNAPVPLTSSTCCVLCSFSYPGQRGGECGKRQIWGA